MPIHLPPRHRPILPQLQNKPSPKFKYKPKPRSNTKYKPKPKPKQSRATQSRNWRSRPHTPMSSIEYVGRYCECGCRSGYQYEYEWSEETVQRQFSYLIPISSPLGPFEDQGTWDQGSEESNEERGPCCWHAVPIPTWTAEGEGEGGRAVWCCGGMCAYLALNLAAATEDTSMPSLVDDSSSAEASVNYEVQEVERGVSGDQGEGQGAGRRMLYRDEWECNFCGSECFCGYQAFATQDTDDE